MAPSGQLKWSGVGSGAVLSCLAGDEGNQPAPAC